MRSRFTVIPRAACLSIAFVFAANGIGAATETPDDGGAIKGTVHITDKLTGQRMRFRLYPGFKPSPAPAERDPREEEWRNVVLYLKSAPPGKSNTDASTLKLTMAQEGETFIPHVLPILVGSTVEFPNHDPIFHNVFSLSGAKTFDLGRYPRGDSRSVTFDQVGIIPVFCHIHSDMSAIIMVLDNPYFTVPGAGGRYRIGNIPPGTYTLVAWHERSKPVEKQVEVIDDHTLELDITVPIENEEPARP